MTSIINKLGTNFQDKKRVLLFSSLLIVGLIFTLTPYSAAACCGPFVTFVNGLTQLVNAIVPLLIGLCILAFIWGVFQYFIKGSGEEDARTKGRSFMVYAFIGFVAVIALWGIVNFIVGGFGFPADTSPSGIPGI